MKFRETIPLYFIQQLFIEDLLDVTMVLGKWQICPLARTTVVATLDPKLGSGGYP